jgi:hypothetical protein
MFKVGDVSPPAGSVLAPGSDISLIIELKISSGSFIVVPGLVREDGAVHILSSCDGGVIPGLPGNPTRGRITTTADLEFLAFAKGHVINGFWLGKYSTSPSDYSIWVATVENHQKCILVSGYDERGRPTGAAWNQADIRVDVPLSWRIE